MQMMPDTITPHQTTEQAFVTVLTQYRGLLYKVARMYTQTSTDCDDLYQEIVVQLWRAWPGFEGRSKVSTWMYRIALNVAISGLRKRRVSIANLDENTLQIPDNSHETVEKQELIAQLYTALEHLSASDKALVLLYFEDLSYDEMAEVTGLQPGHLRVKMLRIRDRIKNILTR
jgi:RNA polymerase sigma-70 factor, ECF subfamily